MEIFFCALCTQRGPLPYLPGPPPVSQRPWLRGTYIKIIIMLQCPHIPTSDECQNYHPTTRHIKIDALAMRQLNLLQMIALKLQEVSHKTTRLHNSRLYSTCNLFLIRFLSPCKPTIYHDDVCYLSKLSICRYLSKGPTEKL